MVAVKNLKSQFSSFEYPTFHVADHKQQLRTKILGKKYIKIFKRFRVLTSTGPVILDLIDFDIRL